MCEGFSVCLPMGMTLSSLSVGSCTKTRLASCQHCLYIRFIRIETKFHSQLVGAVGRQVIGHINSEMEVAPTIEASILTIDIDPRLIVDSAEIEMSAFTSPIRRDVE
jgi:hypothetical protein